MDELKQLKSVLRSLVVSSPTQVDVRSLLRDYRNMMGAPLPIVKYGYRDPLEFLRERFADCFLFQGAPSNPVLTLIVPDTLKHIDKFVQSQRTPKANTKFKGKRRSVPDSILGIPPPRLLPNLDSCQTRTAKPAPTRISSCKEPAKQEAKPKIPEPPGRPEPPPVTPKTLTDPKPITNLEKTENKENERHSGGNYSRLNLENFLRKRSALYTSQQLETESYNDDCTEKNTSDSGRQTASSSSSSKRMQFEELKEEVLQLILDRPEGVWCMELMKLYREQYQRELNFMRYGYTSVVSFACALAPRVRVSPPTDSGDCLVRDATRPAPRPPPRPLTRAPPRAHHASAREPPLDADDALPGVHFDPDVFPSDCMHFMESIPVESISLMSPGDMVEVMVGEVYSPSHLWLIRLGEQYNIAMEDMMDEMTEYYNKGEGKNRTLALGAVQVGHYCSSVYENDWHRSLIVKIVDSDTVKVRHVDYGTVDTVAVRTLKPLLRRWSSPPAQALRARLAALRPPAAGRRWAPAAAAALLRRVRDKRLVACVANIDHEEDILEVFLIDTSTEKEQCISEDLIRSGYADPRHDSALKTSECYLYPRFHALESGAAPNYAEIHAFLRDGIDLQYVHDYRRHLPADALLPPAPASPVSSPSPPAPQYVHDSRRHLPADAPSPPLPPPPPRVELDNRVPLFPRASPLRDDNPSVTGDSESEPSVCGSVSDTVPSPPASPSPPVPAQPAPRPPTAPPRPPPAPPCPPPPQFMMPNFMQPAFPAASMQSVYFPNYPPAPYGPPAPQFFHPISPRMFPGPIYPPMSCPPGFNGMRPAWRPDGPVQQRHPPPAPMPCPAPLRGSYRPAPPVESPTHSNTKMSPGPRSPPPPYNGERSQRERRPVNASHDSVTLSVSECEIFSLLSRVDSNAAHWYMVDAISRRRADTTPTAARPAPAPAPSTLNPHAAEFRHVAATQTDLESSLQPSVRQFMDSLRPKTPRPPPGFD